MAVPGGAEEFLDRALDELEEEGVLVHLTDRQVEALTKDAARRKAARRKVKE